MSRPPCAACRGKGAIFKSCPTPGAVEIVRCQRCNRFTTDKEAAEWHFSKVSVVRLFGAIGIVAFVRDRIECD